MGICPTVGDAVGPLSIGVDDEGGGDGVPDPASLTGVSVNSGRKVMGDGELATGELD